MKISRILFTVHLCLSFLFLPFVVFALDSSRFTDDFYPDSELFYSYLDAADQKNNSEQWMDYARFGIETAVSEWEKELRILSDEDFDPVELRNEASAELYEILKKRYADWLARNFFNSIDPPSLAALSRQISELNAQYLYIEDDEGNITYRTTVDYSDVFTTDSAGNDVVARKGEKTLWVEGVKSGISELLDNWAGKMATAFAELKASVTDETVLQTLERDYLKDYESYRDSYRNQLYRLYNLEQSRFTRLRLYDQYSLEHQSGQETASSISRRLIAETEAKLDGRLGALVSGIKARSGGVETEGIIIDADDWYESFSALLSQGMDSWDEAEQALLMNRIEWEHQAADEVSGGEEAWEEAFEQLSEKRTEWMNEYRVTLREGNLLWAEENRELNSAIERAVTEIDENIRNSEASLQGRIDNLTGIILQSVNMMRTARTSWEYWMDCFDGGEKGSFNADGTDSDYDSMIQVMSSTRPDISAASRKNDEDYGEAFYWAGIFKTYRQYALDSQISLADTYGIVVFDDPSIRTAFSGDDLIEPLLYEDILSGGDSWESFYLDEGQVELLKARACMQYWEKQREKAQAVYDYAVDSSSTKENADVTLKRLSDAKAAYEAVLSEYTGYMDRLSDISMDLKTLQSGMKTIQDKISGYRQRLEAAREGYNSAINDLGAGNGEFLAGRFREYYLSLLDSMGMTEDSSSHPAEVLEEYLLSASEYGSEKQISLVSGRIIELINGREDLDPDSRMFNPETASLSDLRNRMETVSNAGFVSGASTGGGLFGLAGNDAAIEMFNMYLEQKLLLPMDDYRSEMLIGFFTEYMDSNTGEIEKSRLLWRMQLIVDEIQQVNRFNYEQRLAEIKLLTADDFASWTGQYFNTETAVSDPEDFISLAAPSGLNGISAAIGQDLKIFDELLELYRLHSVSGSGNFTIYDWKTLPGDIPPALSKQQALQIIWDYYGGDTAAETAAEINKTAESLRALVYWLDSLGSLPDHIPELESAVLNPEEALGQDYLKLYLNGGSRLSTDMGDMHSVIYSDLGSRRKTLAGLAGIISADMDTALCLSSDSYDKSRSAIMDTLSQFGLMDPDTLTFYSPERIWSEGAFSTAAEVAVFFTELDAAVSSLSLPEYLAEILLGYGGELKDYLSVRAAPAFTEELSGDMTSLDNEIRYASDTVNSLGVLLGGLQKNSDHCVKLLSVAKSEAVPEELRAEAETRLIETSAFALAGDSLAVDGFSDSEPEWIGLYEDFISNSGLGMGRDTGIDGYRSGIIRRASDLRNLAFFLSDPDSVDSGIWSGEQLEAYSAMLWNSLDLSEAFEQINGACCGLDSTAVDDLLITLPGDLLGLARSRAGAVYSSMIACGLGAVLVETEQYSIEDAIDFVNRFLDEKGIETVFTRERLSDYLLLGSNERFYSILAEYPDAACHYLKNKIAEGALTSESLSAVLDSIELPAEKEFEIKGIQEIIDDVEVYNGLMHGDSEDYLEARYESRDRRRMAREIYMRFRGSPERRWDDYAFLPPSGTEPGAAEILENLACNRTGNTVPTRFDAGTVISPNEVFFNEALVTIHDQLYTGESPLISGLLELRAEKDLRIRASVYLDSIETADPDNWRSFLNDDYLSSDRDELVLVPAQTVGQSSSDYVRNLQIGGAGPAIENFDSFTVFSATGDDQQNIILDASNSCLDQAAYLVSALNHWTEETLPAATAIQTLHAAPDNLTGIDFGSNPESASSTEIEQVYSYEIDPSVESRYSASRTVFKDFTAEIESIKETLSALGFRRARLVRTASLEGDEQLEELRPLRDEISRLELNIDSAQEEWQQLIDGPEGYRALEEEYTDVYSGARKAAGELDERRQEYSKARAIYEYASAGYLSLDDESLTDFTPSEPEADGDPAADDAYHDALLATINRVSPEERLSYITGKFTRAKAACDALETIIAGKMADESVYAKDDVYRALFDNYLKTFRESLVLNRINLVLNKSIVQQESLTREALEDWRMAVNDTYDTAGILASDSTSVPNGLESCNLSRKADGSWKISWGGVASDPETFTEYFGVNENGFSDFQNDLTIWLEKIKSVLNGGWGAELLTTWAMARKWEEYLAEGKPDSINDSFWTDFLNRNGEDDLDREGAKSLLVSKWKKAYNDVNAYTGDNGWLYSFYRLLDKGGIMKLDTGAAAGGSLENLSFLAENESLILANQYMSDQYSEDARNFYLSAIPMFTLAVSYFTAATIALAIPFNWIAAIVLFAMGTAAALSGSYLVGEGAAKDAAADNIKNQIIKPARSDSRKFLIEFRQNAEMILDKKQVYDDEHARLLAMRGTPADGEILTDEQRISLLKNSTLEAFSETGDDLHGLLYRGGLVSASGDVEGDAAALTALFSDYQKLMGQQEKDSCLDSSRFISALEQESQDYRLITARELSDYLTGEGGVEGVQAGALESYRESYSRYLDEETDLDGLMSTADSAFGEPVFSLREHILRLYEQQALIAEKIMGSNQFDTDISADLLESQKALLCGSADRQGIYDLRMSSYRDVRMYELKMLQLAMNEKYSNWENQMRAIAARGELEWNAGRRRLAGEYGEWNINTKRLYDHQVELWDDKYLDFINDKQVWLEQAAVQSTMIGNPSVLDSFGEMTDAAAAAAGGDLLLSDFSIPDIEPDLILSGLIDFELLGTILEHAELLCPSPGNIEQSIFSGAVPDRFSSSDELQAIKDFQGSRNEDYKKHLAELQLNQMLARVEDAEENFFRTVENANKGINSSLNRTMKNDGYVRSGGRYRKELVIGATIGGYVYGAGYVSTYNDYIPDGIDFGRELRDARGRSGTLDAEGLLGLVASAMDSIGEKLKWIFGSDDETENGQMLAELGFAVDVLEDETEKGIYHYRRKSENLIDGIFPEFLHGFADRIAGAVSRLPDAPGKAELEVSRARKHFGEMSPGLFGIHLGYAPLFSDEVDLTLEWNDTGQIKYEGLGEMGRIQGEYIFNRMKENAGWVEVNMPHYEKPLWEGEFLGIKAPSAADLTNIAVTVCTAGALGAVSGASSLITAGINLSDDFALAAMNVATGNKDIIEAGFNFTRKAAVSLIGAGAGDVFDTAGAGLTGVGEKTLLAAGEQVFNQTVSSLVNSADLKVDQSGNIIFDYDFNALQQGIAGEGAVAGIIGSVAGTAAGYGLNNLITGTMTPLEQEFYGSLGDLGSLTAQQVSEYGVYLGYQIASDGFNDIGSSMAEALDDMGMSINILDIGSIIELAGIAAAGISDNPGSEFLMNVDSAAENLKGTGLLALNLGSKGVSGQITTGGINAGRLLYSLGKGFTADMALKAFEAGQNKGAEMLKTGYLYGDQALENTIWRVLSGKDELVFDVDEGEAQTILKSGGGRAVHMNTGYSDPAAGDLYKAVTVLQHEAYRDGSLSNCNDIETLRAVKAHTEVAIALGKTFGFDFIAGDRNLLDDVAAYIASKGGSNDSDAYSEYVEDSYDSSEDFWKLIENPDGSLTLNDDGRGGVFYTDENGEEHEIGHYLKGSRTEHLQKVLGLELTEEEKQRLNAELLVGLGAAETYKAGHFIDRNDEQISINLSGEWADRMGAALDYDRMFVDAWRNEGNMDMMVEELRYMNISEMYGADYSNREKYLADMYDKAIDFSRRFSQGTATEFLFNQTEIENAVGFGADSLCYATVPVNLYQLNDPSISLDMVADAVMTASNLEFIRNDGYLNNYSKYLKLLGSEFNSDRYLLKGYDYGSFQAFLSSKYSMADFAIYGEDENEHHMLYRDSFDLIDPYQDQLAWDSIESYRFRGLEWESFK